MPRPRQAASLAALALEVRDLCGLLVGALVRVRQLVLGFTLALLPTALATQARVVRQIAGRLLRAARQLVQDAHRSFSSFGVSFQLDPSPKPRGTKRFG